MIDSILSACIGGEYSRFVCKKNLNNLARALRRRGYKKVIFGHTCPNLVIFYFKPKVGYNQYSYKEIYNLFYQYNIDTNIRTIKTQLEVGGTYRFIHVSRYSGCLHWRHNN